MITHSAHEKEGRDDITHAVRAWSGKGSSGRPYVVVSTTVAASLATQQLFISTATARSLARRLARAADEAERLAREGAEAPVEVEDVATAGTCDRCDCGGTGCYCACHDQVRLRVEPWPAVQS